MPPVNTALSAVGLEPAQPQQVFRDRSGRQHSRAVDADIANLKRILEHKFCSTVEGEDGRKPAEIPLPSFLLERTADDLACWILENSHALLPYLQAYLSLKPQPDPPREVCRAGA